MKKQSNGIMGITAPAPHPNWRGFLQLALYLSGPVAVFLIGGELLLRHLKIL